MMTFLAVSVSIGFQLSIKYVLLQDSERKMALTELCLLRIIKFLIKTVWMKCI